MKKEAISCENCGMDYTVVYDAEESVEDPLHCPFCGEIASPEDLDGELDIEEDWD